MTTSDHKEQYRGKNLLLLMTATFGPAALLFFRSVFSRAGQTATATTAQWLNRFSIVALVIFYLAQLASAWYLRRMLPARPAWWSQALQFAGLFVMGLFISLTGAIMLEAFGYSLWIHLRR